MFKTEPFTIIKSLINLFVIIHILGYVYYQANITQQIGSIKFCKMCQANIYLPFASVVYVHAYYTY